MDIYFYCSYTGSPVGFIIGQIQDVSSGTGDTPPMLGDKDINPFIRLCFENGVIRNSCGAIPETFENAAKYFFVHKSSKSVTISENPSVQYYINVAFLCNTKEEFSNVFNRWYDQSDEMFNQSILETIKINRSTKFGYEVSYPKLLELISQTRDSNMYHLLELLTNGNSIYDFSTKAPDLFNLARLLTNNTNERYELVPIEKSSYFLLQKKKTARTALIRKKCLLFVIAIIFLAATPDIAIFLNQTSAKTIISSLSIKLQAIISRVESPVLVFSNTESGDSIPSSDAVIPLSQNTDTPTTSNDSMLPLSADSSGSNDFILSNKSADIVPDKQKLKNTLIKN